MIETREKDGKFASLLDLCERSEGALNTRMLEHLARAGFPLAKVLFATDGSEFVEVPGPDGKIFLARLLTWLPGKVLAEVNPQTPGLFQSLGAFLGGMDRALEDFSHPAQDRELKWDLKGAGRVVRSHLKYVEDEASRELLEEMGERFTERLADGDPESERAVLGIINGFGNRAVPPLERAYGKGGLLQKVGLNRRRQLHRKITLARALGQIGTHEAIQSLRRLHAREGDPDLEQRLLAILERLDRKGEDA